MNKSGVLTCRAEREALVGFEYKVPKEECVFVGRLICRNWYNNRNVYGLVCNFITEGDKKIALFAFRHKLPNEIYAPRNCDIDFAHDVEDGSIWRCTHVAFKYGHLFWKSAELISGSGDDSLFSYETITTYTQKQIEEAIRKRDERRRKKAEAEAKRKSQDIVLDYKSWSRKLNRSRCLLESFSQSQGDVIETESK